MARRKGEITKSQIDREWPFQVALPSRQTVGPAYVSVRLFAEKLSLSPRGHCFVRDGEYWNVWCFAVREDAEAFRARFGGELMSPSDRTKWPG
jgi:hypothetical protein